MEIIPVIDLMHGQVVHAKQGQRQNYLPLQSTLCIGSAPFDVLIALLELYPFKTIYIADIDAIQGVGNHSELITAITKDFPRINFWLDNGIRQAHEISVQTNNLCAVMGTENIENLATFQAISVASTNHHILSLDSLNGQTLGTSNLHKDSQYWPAEVICMNLNQVGSALGPDFDMLNELAQLNRQRTAPSKLYAAGGVRNIDDCIQLKKMGISGALIASALHNGIISSDELALLATQN
ncbi:MAG TPA: HisA/HisF-related TIM barrel protein [Methylotenera sp.]|nr:HisA/HisF-related TIM barrel protein [Methylotenera sp.]